MQRQCFFGENAGKCVRKNLQKSIDKPWALWYTILARRGVAQFGRVLGSGPRGRWFESSHSDEKSVEMLKKLECFGFFRAFFGGVFRHFDGVASSPR